MSKALMDILSFSWILKPWIIFAISKDIDIIIALDEAICSKKFEHYEKTLVDIDLEFMFGFFFFLVLTIQFSEKWSLIIMSLAWGKYSPS